MKRIVYAMVLGLAAAAPAWASEGGHALDHVKIDLHDKEALKRGAQTFVNYCLNCHAASYMRYSRVARDLGISEDEMRKSYLFASPKLGETMTVAMTSKDAVQWLGVAPPDLSDIARYRGSDWLYTYLRGFYADPARPAGANNHLFKDVAMPNVLWELQGIQTLESGEHGDKLTLTQPGKQTPEQFDHTVADLVNFLAYVGEPAKLERERLIPWVFGYLLLLLVVLYLLKKEYWKDIR